MNTRKFVSFDWAIKKILRHKENFEGMSPQDKAAYNRHIENRRVEMNVMDTLKIQVEQQKAVQVATTFLAAGIDPVLIAQGTQLTLDEIQRIARGEDILDNYI